MVTAPRALDVRPVGPTDFEAIFPLLALLENPKMSRDGWRTMLFDYPWGTDEPRGFALFAHGVAVGFLGTIFSRRRIHGRDELFCNPSAWMVQPEYRHASNLLLRPLLARRDCTIVNLTPMPRSYEIFAKLGFRPLEREQLLLAPLGSPQSIMGGSFTADAREMAPALGEDELAISATLRSFSRARQILLRRGGRSCYLVATPLRVKRVPFAELQHLSDPAFAWDHRALLHLAVWQTMGAIGIAVDSRFARGRTLPFSARRPAARLYRPDRVDLAPEAVDSLFSELMTLRI